MRQRLPELTLRLLRDRYEALARIRTSSQAEDGIPVRLLGRPALAVTGERGAKAFYDTTLVRRKGAVPAPIRLVLFGPGAVHGLDGAEHLERKAIFLQIVTPQTVADLVNMVTAKLDLAVPHWQNRPTVTLFDELVAVYGSAVLEWAGTGTTGEQARGISRELALIVDGFGVGGTAFPRAVVARLRAQRWALRVIREARSGNRMLAPHSAVEILSASDLPDLVAATELINVVRPTVAVAYFGAYAAQALDRLPTWKRMIADGSALHTRAFQLEMRRWYPFAPLLAGRLLRAYQWGGFTVARRGYLILDIRGINRDPSLWDKADDFDPDRFLDHDPTPYDFVPQGGGHPQTGHRCPGEPIAEGIIEATLQVLARLSYGLTDASREVPTDRIPSLPTDRMRLLAVQAAAPVRSGGDVFRDLTHTRQGD